MSNIDEFIQLIESQRTSRPTIESTQETQEPEATIHNLSDDDFSDILAENGFNESTEEPSTDIEEETIENQDYEESEVSPSTELDPDILNAVNLAFQENEVIDSSNEEIEDKSLLPLNSPTLLISEATTRFSGAEWFQEIQKAKIIIAGVGGIGSNVAFQIARMVPASLTLYDNDTVEVVNMAGQLYSYEDVGKAKVNAIATMISKYTKMSQVYAIRDVFSPLTEPGDIMICGFDNMRARRIFFDSWYTHIGKKEEADRAKCLFIDGRLSMDTLQVLCIQGNDEYSISKYRREYLFSDAEADSTVCSMKQTTYLACMIGSVIVNLFTNFIANTLDPIIPYRLPFFTEYDAQHMLFKTMN